MKLQALLLDHAPDVSLFRDLHLADAMRIKLLSSLAVLLAFTTTANLFELIYLIYLYTTV